MFEKLRYNLVAFQVVNFNMGNFAPVRFFLQVSG